METGFEKAIQAAKSQARLGKLIGRPQQTISYWKRHGVPAEAAILIEQATGVPRHEIRPDVFGPKVGRPPVEG